MTIAAILAVVCALTFSWPVGAMSLQERQNCRSDGCVTQYGCVPRYSQYKTAFYCPQRCVIERCRSVENEPQPRVCHKITSVATGQTLAAMDAYDRRGDQRYTSLANPNSERGEQRYASLVNSNSGERDSWNLIVGPGNYYYIQNSDTREYLRASDNNYLYVVSGRPTDESFLFKPELVQGSWSSVLLQSVCYRGYIFGEQYSGRSSSFAMMTRDLDRCYRESLWSVSSVNC
uniref:23.4 kDa salivary protein n=1 Tax=Anopheles christyi TaxID=43041 RepID=A0A182KJ71_9DIPT